VAHWREQKDHVTLLRAFAIVSRRVPAAHLLLLGTAHDDAYGGRVRRELMALGLEQRVSVLGCREDVAAVLLGCDIGVLSSASEGLPLALLEYGWAGLPAVATRVGECQEVLDGGRAGRLVSPSSPEELAVALLRLLASADERCTLGAALAERVRQVYSPEGAVAAVCRLYEALVVGTSGDSWEERASVSATSP
jgi:glycosyltransferase involved in cell wall biosynthesis